MDMGVVANVTHDRRHADTAMENYVTTTVMAIITTFFSSPFSDQSTTVQVKLDVAKYFSDQLHLPSLADSTVHLSAAMFH